MLDSLTTRLTGIFDRLRGFGRLTEENIQEALREVRVALLEADVNFKVVKGFIERVRVKAIGQDVLTSLTPGQQVVKIVRDELIELLGGSGHRLARRLPSRRDGAAAAARPGARHSCAGRGIVEARGHLPGGPRRGGPAGSLAAHPRHGGTASRRR